MLEAILEYQKKDGQLVKIENEISNSKAKKVVNQMVAVVKDGQQKIVSIEKNANNLIKSFQDLEANFNKQNKLLDSLNKTKLEDLQPEKLEQLEKQTNAITAELLVLEKSIAKLSKEISATLKDFEASKKDVLSAKQRHKQAMQAYNTLLETKKEEMENLKKELAELEKKAEPKLIQKYKKMREDKKYPVFVPLLKNSCGGCLMELSISQHNKLDEKGMLECENCHRIIYKK